MMAASFPPTLAHRVARGQTHRPPSRHSLHVAKIALAACILLGTIPQTEERPDYQKAAAREVMRGSFQGCKWLRIYLDEGHTFDESEADRIRGIRWRNACQGLEGF